MKDVIFPGDTPDFGLVFYKKSSRPPSRFFMINMVKSSENQVFCFSFTEDY